MLVRGRAVHVPGGSSVNAQRIKSWAQAVADGWTVGGHDALRAGPVGVAMIFRLPMRRGDLDKRGAPKPGAPLLTIVKPDGDKLVRATLDAMTVAGAWTDDAQVAELRACRIYTPPGPGSGASIYVTALNPFFPLDAIRALSAAYESEIDHHCASLARSKADALDMVRAIARTKRAARSAPSADNGTNTPVPPSRNHEVGAPESADGATPDLFGHIPGAW